MVALVRPSVAEHGFGGAVHPPAPTVVRWAAGAIVFFLADAMQLLFLLPDRSGELFAWPIAPALSAYVLAAAYTAGAYFFARIALGAPWERVAAGLAPVTLFVWLLAAATLLHLDRFRTGTLPFVAWAALYTLAPLAIPSYLLLGPRLTGAGQAPQRLPTAVRAALATLGGAVVAAALLVFADPAAFAGGLPWAMTPLTARVVMAVVALFGAVWVSVAVDGRRSAASIVLEAQATGLAALLGGVLIGGVSVGHPPAAVLLVGAAVMLAATLAVRLRWGGCGARSEP
jgi:hypothetical protein